MKRLIHIIALAAGFLAGQLRMTAAGVALPVQMRLENARFNILSQAYATHGGVPVSSENGSGSGNPAQAGQFKSWSPLGAAGVPQTAEDRQAIKASTILKAGATPFDGTVAAEMRLPRVTSNGVVTMVLRRTRIGTPYVSQQVSFFFGSVIPPPVRRVDGDDPTSMTDEEAAAYWFPEPYLPPGTEPDGYYYSRNSGKVYAVQAGPLRVTWRKRASTRTVPAPEDAQNWYDSGGNFYRLVTTSYLASGSPVQPPRKIYWTEKTFLKVGKLVNVPANRVQGVHIVYSHAFPRTVAAEYEAEGQSSPVEGTGNNLLAELRTLWFDQQTGQIHAYNAEGRVFIEFLGDPRPDGQSSVQLGIEIVDVYKTVNPQDLRIELGDRVVPPPPGSLEALSPEPLDTGSVVFAYAGNPPGADVPQYYATRETRNLNDFSVHWLEAGVAGIRWPAYFARYAFAWPVDVERYSQYMRPHVASAAEAMLTAVPLPTENVPVIEYQDPLDFPRAHLTEDFKFYTYMGDAPAHRTLLRFSSGENIYFERVFSWLGESLQRAAAGPAPEFGNSVATALEAWNPGTRTFQWPPGFKSPRLLKAKVSVGQRLSAPDGETGSGGGPDYLAGYIRPAAGNLFNPGAYVEPFANGFTAANRGAIIPVNAVPGMNTLEVWWFRPNGADHNKGFNTLFWPAVIGTYTIGWPANPQEIVMAGKNGNVDETNVLVASGTIYRQADPSLPGYNPNEEHALVSGGRAYALRDDLNITSGPDYSSEPYVLLDYQEADGRPAMAVYRVLREKPERGWIFDYLVNAGTRLEPPMPLPLVSLLPVEGSGDHAVNFNREVIPDKADLPGNWKTDRDAVEGAPFSHYNQFTYRDRKHEFWVYRGLHAGLPVLVGGTYHTDTRSFSAPPPATAVVGQPFQFTLHVSRQDQYLTLAPGNPLPVWLSISNLTLVGTPTAASAQQTLALRLRDDSDQSQVLVQIKLTVAASGPVVTQAALVINSVERPGLTVSFTNRPPFLAHTPTGTNSFVMQFYYKTLPGFDWPGIPAPVPAGTIVPYLRPEDPAHPGAYLGDRDQRGTASLSIVFRPVWPSRDPKDAAKNVPVLAYGQTLTGPANGLPEVRAFKTARVLYQQSIASDILAAAPSARLHDATRIKTNGLDRAALDRIPPGVATDFFQGRYYFPLLPPHLATRVYFDPNIGTKGCLVLKGEYHPALVGESYTLLNVLRGDDLLKVKALCPAGAGADKTRWDNLVDGLQTPLETFHENPDRPGTYIADPTLTVVKGVGDLAEITHDNSAVDSYALSATGPGAGYITILESGGTAFTDPGDPVNMHVVRVGGSLFPGELKVLEAANPLSELVSFQHTGDLAGRADEYVYEWRIAAPVDGGPPPSAAYTPLVQGVPGVFQYTIGGAGIQALSDNYVQMRYRPNNPAHPLYKAAPTDTDWSDWTSPVLSEGWIKRVLRGINPFNQRTKNLFENRANTTASIIAQAGHRWEGDLALNADTLDSHGLIEIYETVLRRGRMLSIESGYNYGPANDALLLAAGYINDLYMMLGNEAWADAANPTIGIGTKDQTYGEISTALFAFKGQVPSLLEEELGLLRGRDDFLQPGVQTPPFYNRLVWNYTRGIDSGEVIYALNYNILDQNYDGVVDATDAALLYPQAHGDAYGHYLTALKGYYSLLLNSNFDWVPRIEAVSVLGQPVAVDYLDERKFAAAAVAVARAGRQVFDLTWRKDYQPDGTAGWDYLGATRENPQRTFTRLDGSMVNSVRYWGLDHAMVRTGQGAYLNWLVGNAILPAIDPNPQHEGIQKVDRTTVPELAELPALADGLQTDMDNAEGRLTPIGLAPGALAFDINPSQVLGLEGTHFEQIYQRAKVALNNAVAAFDDAKDVTRLMRSEEDSLADLRAGVLRQEIAYTNTLVALYGTPYPDDVGPGKTYKQEDAKAPDVIHFAYVDTPQLTFPGLLEPDQPKTFKIDIQNYTANYEQGDKTRFDFLVTALNNNPDYRAGADYVEFTLDGHGNFTKPAAWTGRRASPGKLQDAISRILLARNAARQALQESDNARRQLDRTLEYFQASLAVYASVHDIHVEQERLQTAIQGALFAGRMLALANDTYGDSLDKAAQASMEAVAKSTIVGTAVGGDTFSAARSAILASFGSAKGALDSANFLKEFAIGAFQVARESFMRYRTVEIIEPLERLAVDQQAVLQLDTQLSGVQEHLFTINARLQELDDAVRDYRAVQAEGDRLQAERLVYRQRIAAVIQGYRTRDAAFRLFRNEKLERYKALFDLAARYTYLAANAYDYETGLLGTSEGQAFINRILSSRALGVVRAGEPQYAGSDTGDPGLSSVLAGMKADWTVLKGRLGFNNPDAYGTTASLRTENFRIVPGTNGDPQWRNILEAGKSDNLLNDPDVRRYCMQIDPGNGLPVPGVILTFSTTIENGLNLFGKPLAAGDHAYSPSSFATKIFAAGVALVGYRGMDNPAANSGTVGTAGGNSPPDPTSSFLDPLALAANPYVYLIPVGVDAMRSPPLGDQGSVRTWTVDDSAIPLPFNLGASDFSTKAIYTGADSLTEPLFTIRKHQAFRPISNPALFNTSLYTDEGLLQRSQYTNNRLVARSVWNTRWKLVIPATTLLNDPDEGLDRFMQTVTDIKLNFVTYSYSGN